MSTGPVVIVDLASFDNLKAAVLEYLSEVDNPVPDYLRRVRLRDRLRELTGAPPAPAPGHRLPRRQR